MINEEHYVKHGHVASGNTRGKPEMRRRQRESRAKARTGSHYEI